MGDDMKWKIMLIYIYTSPTKTLAATTPSAVVIWLKYAIGLNNAADFTLSICFPSEKEANAIKVPYNWNLEQDSNT